MSDLAPSFIQVFTWHAKAEAEANCKFIRAIVNMVIQNVIGLVIAGLTEGGGFVLSMAWPVVMEEAEIMFFLNEVVATQLKNNTGKVASPVWQQLSQDFSTLVMNDVARAEAATVAPSMADRSWIWTNPAADPLCRDIDVGGGNMDSENTNLVRLRIGDLMKGIKRSIRNSYYELYQGVTPNEGRPSLLSSMLDRLIWSGPNSILLKVDRFPDEEKE
jgi:hypothetical protein